MFPRVPRYVCTLLYPSLYVSVIAWLSSPAAEQMESLSLSQTSARGALRLAILETCSTRAVPCHTGESCTGGIVATVA